MMNTIEKILADAKKNGIAEEVREQLEDVEFEISELEQKNSMLKSKNRILQAQKSKSKVEEFRKSNKSLKERNKKLNDKLKELTKKRKTYFGCLTQEELGVYSRMLNDFESTEKNYQEIVFPNVDHPIFNRFFELANRYPNREFVVSSLHDNISKKEKLIKKEIELLKNNIEMIKKCQEEIKLSPNDWEENVNNKAVYLYKVTTIPELEKKISQLEKNIEEINKWFTELKNNIPYKPERTTAKIENEDYCEIFKEFDKIYNLCANIKSISRFKANIVVDSFNKDVLCSSLAKELQTQIGLCEEPYSHNFYYSNGGGRLVPYELNRTLLGYISENTTFIQSNGKKNKYRSGDIISSKMLFEEIPLYCKVIQHKISNLVGFNNCFYDITKDKVIKLNPNVPIMPLKNTKTELYLKKDNKIEENPMQKIFEECFTNEDRRTILAYLGCALFDKGYTQRQESLFIMGKGGTGKTTFTKAICSIFYNVGHQLVGKFKDSNEFGLSVFADSDVVIVDEIQSAPAEFANKLKNISSSDALPVEKKHTNTISIPAENIPRMFLIGNNFSKKLYEESDNEGVRRRILIVIPTKPIQSLGYQWKDLIQPSCQQWLVQEAIEEYKAQHLHEKSIPIGWDENGGYITDGDKDRKLEMCVYPERFFVKEHFKVSYIDGETINNDKLIKYSDMFTFIKQCINENMVESTCKESASNMFIGEVNKALRLEGHRTRTINGEYYFTGIVPKSERATEYLKELKEKRTTAN